MTEKEASPQEKVRDRAAVFSYERIRCDQQAAGARVGRALAHIRKNLFRRGYNVSQLRAELGLRDNEFPCEFRLQVGASPHTYIENRRLETGCQLLVTTDLAVAEIGFTLGYRRPVAFSDAFDRRMGCRPTVFRRLVADGAMDLGKIYLGGSQSRWTELPHFLVGIGTTVDGERCWRCRAQLPSGKRTRMFENLKPVCDSCAREHGPAELTAFVREPVVGAVPAAAEVRRTNEQERLRAAAVWREIEGLPLVEQQQRLRDHASLFRTEALLAVLHEESRRSIGEDPRRGLGLAELAVTAAEAIDDELVGEPGRHDAAADARAWLANARRMADDFQGAHQALAAARKHYHQGTREPTRWARILDYEASLRRDQRRFERALACLERVIRIYRETSEPNLVAKVLIKKATVYQEWCRPDHAVPLLRHALALLDSEAQPILLLSACQSLGVCLCELGRYDEAGRLLPLLQELVAHGNHLADQARVRWLQGRIDSATGRTGSGIRAMKDARATFIELELPYDAALVTLDLAAKYAETHREQEMVDLAAAMVPIFESKGIHREATAALTALRCALKVKRLPKGLVSRLRRDLKQAQRNREPRFRDFN